MNAPSQINKETVAYNILNFEPVKLQDDRSSTKECNRKRVAPHLSLKLSFCDKQNSGQKQYSRTDKYFGLSLSQDLTFWLLRQLELQSSKSVVAQGGQSVTRPIDESSLPFHDGGAAERGAAATVWQWRHCSTVVAAVLLRRGVVRHRSGGIGERDIMTSATRKCQIDSLCKSGFEVYILNPKVKSKQLLFYRGHPNYS